MSRILRRPMFRGGRVDSRGTGITSGLMDTSKPKRGLVDEPGGYAGEEFLIGQGMYDEFVNRPNNTRSGANIFSKALEKARGIPYLGRAVPFLTGATGTFGAAAGAGIGAGQLADFYAKSTSTPLGYKKLKEVSSRPFYFDETNIDVGEGLDEIRTANEIGEAPGFFPRGGKDKFYEDKGLDPETGLPSEVDRFLPTPGPEKGSVPKKIENNLLSNNSILNKQNTANEELTLEEVRDTLGYKKAKGRDIGDMLARASASFLGTGEVREGLAEFMKSEAAAGPGRAEKIETAAATFMLKDKAQTKRDKANIELMKSKVDYQIEAGESISLPKSLLAANKSGMLNNKELSVGIQAATSPTTGKNFNFKKVVTLEEFKNIKDAQPGDTFVVKTTVKDLDTGTEKILKSIIEIDLDGTPQRIYNIA